LRWRGGPDFQYRFDKSTAQAEEMKEGGPRPVTSPTSSLRVLREILRPEEFRDLSLDADSIDAVICQRGITLDGYRTDLKAF
jgi:hypothetical protein